MRKKVKQLGLLFICIVVLVVIIVFGLHYIKYNNICNFDYDIDVNVQPKSDTYSKDDDLVFEVSIKNQGETNIHNLEVFIEREGYVSLDGYTTVYHKDELLPGKLTSYLAGLSKSNDEIELHFNKESYTFQLKILSLIVRVITVIFVVLILLCLYKKRLKRDIVVLVLGVLISLGFGFYLQAKQRDENILKTLVQELEVNIDGRNEKFKVYTSFTKENVSGFIDINNNDIPDCIEHSDFWTDTDGDGLSDYYELCLTGTSPLLVKTYATDLADSNYDTDKDGLSNFYELKHELEALNTDSDFDGLEDLSEVEIGTDSLDWDTDKDGASDGWEVSNGYDPLRKEELFENTAECFSKGNNTKNDMIARAKVKASGDVIESLDIEEYNTMLVNDKIPGYIGSAFNFTLDGEFEEAEITFEFDEYNLGYDKGEFEPCIYYFNEDTQLLEELDCEVNGDCVSAKVEHFSVYILLNKLVVDEEIFADMFRHDLDSKDVTIEFVLDRSYSMSETDPTGQTKEIVSDFVDKISASDYNISGLGLVTFIGVSEIQQKISDDLIEFKQKLDALVIDDGEGEESGSNITEGLRAGMFELMNDKSESNKYIILVTDGQERIIDIDWFRVNLRRYGIKLYCVNFSEANMDNFKDLCVYSGGRYLGGNSTFEGILVNDFKYIENDVIQSTKDGFLLDSNNDGITDYHSRLLCDGIVLTGTGIRVFDELDCEKLESDKDYDGDGLLNGQEVQLVEYKGNLYVKFNSNPFLEDTDMDGLLDSEDTAPFTKGLKGGIVGELFLVSCGNTRIPIMPSKLGHSWLVYHSYINDVFDTDSIYDGYTNYDVLDTLAAKHNICPYFIKKGKYMSLGLSTSGYFSTLSGNISTTKDNWSLVFDDKLTINAEFYNLQENDKYYVDAVAYGREITYSDFCRLQDDWINVNVYAVLLYDCTTYATRAWGTLFKEDMQELTGLDRGIPFSLKLWILRKGNHINNYERLMLNYLEQWNK